MTTVAQAFTNVYARAAWGNEGGRSGPGSSELQASGASRIVFHLIMALNLQSMIDAPCGAMVWQTPLLHQIVFNVPGFRFLGIDVVNSVVEKNNQRFAHQWASIKNVTKFNPEFSVNFAQANLADKDWSVPRGHDLLLCRDALQHNKLRHVWRILYNFAESDVKYLLIGSYPDGSFYCRYTEGGSPNIDIRNPGGFFCIDLMREPFNLRPMKILREGTHDRKTLYLFDRESLRRDLPVHTHVRNGTRER